MVFLKSFDTCLQLFEITAFVHYSTLKEQYKEFLDTFGLFINVVQGHPRLYVYRVCHGFRLRREQLIFESILTLFKLSIVFGGSLGRTENWLKIKIKPQSGNLACTNL